MLQCCAAEASQAQTGAGTLALPDSTSQLNMACLPHSPVDISWPSAALAVIGCARPCLSAARHTTNKAFLQTQAYIAWHFADDREAIHGRVILAAALLAMCVPDVVQVVLPEFVFRDFGGHLTAPELDVVLQRHANALQGGQSRC